MVITSVLRRNASEMAAAVAADEAFDVDGAFATLRTLWPLIVILDVAYVLFVNYGVEYALILRPRRVLLQDASILWNSLNAFTSAYMFFALLPEFLTSISNGWYYTICNEGTFYTGKYSGYAMYLFCWSKVWELGDTILLILRGRRIIFLHWFHHAVVVFQVVGTYYTAGSMARLGTVMNTFVHTLMYAYFAIQNFASGIRSVAPVITCLQLAQFVIACVGMASLVIYVLAGHQCDTAYRQIPMHFVVYMAFLILFLNFFYNSYISTDSISKSKRQRSVKKQRRSRLKRH